MLGVETVDRMYPGQLIQHYLLSAYCYYHLDDSPLTDAAFDRLCVRLGECWDTLEHQHKGIISKGDIDAGTCLLSADDFPNMVKHSAYDYIQAALSRILVVWLEPHLMPAHK